METDLVWMVPNRAGVVVECHRIPAGSWLWIDGRRAARVSAGSLACCGGHGAVIPAAELREVPAGSVAWLAPMLQSAPARVVGVLPDPDSDGNVTDPLRSAGRVGDSPPAARPHFTPPTPRE